MMDLVDVFRWSVHQISLDGIGRFEGYEGN